MKILYGLPSEGMGHATRSKVILEHLIKSHDVQIVTSDRAFVFLNKHFPGRVHRIEGFHLAYKNAIVSVKETILKTLKDAPKQGLHNMKVMQEIAKKFNPDIVISDFESFTNFYAKRYKKPLLSIDNMQVINRTQLDISIPLSEKSNFLLAKNIIKAKVPSANHYFISTFFQSKVCKNNTTLVPPIIRNEILDVKTAYRNYIVVYQTSTSQKDLILILNQLPNENFIVYGFNKNEIHFNVTLKTFSEEGFITDFAQAKAVFSNGGFSFLSEAVYLQKPILSVPIKNQFEQFVNASYVEKEGFGRYFTEFSANNIKSFLYDLPFIKQHSIEYKQNGNAILFEKLDSEIAHYSSSIG